MSRNLCLRVLRCLVKLLELSEPKLHIRQKSMTTDERGRKKTKMGKTEKSQKAIDKKMAKRAKKAAKKARYLFNLITCRVSESSGDEVVAPKKQRKSILPPPDRNLVKPSSALKNKENNNSYTQAF
jgi:hypothetical protein